MNGFEKEGKKETIKAENVEVIVFIYRSLFFSVFILLLQ